MFSPYELFIGMRHTRARRRTHFVSFITITSILGIVVGITALITILSVMNGFEKEVRDRILGFASHITVSRYGESVADWPTLAESLLENPRVEAAAPYIRAEGMLTHNSQARGVLVRGILPEQEKRVSKVADRMVEGNFDDLADGKYNILLGQQLAQKLGVLMGDRITLVIPQTSVTIAGVLPRLRSFRVAGIFKVDVFEYDSILAMVHLKDAARLFRYGEGVSGVRLHLDDLYSARPVGKELQGSIGNQYYVQDWTDLNANWFRAVQLEKRIMFIVVSLVLAVAAFNIVATLVMVVRDKEADIAILRTLGATPGSIMKIFVIQGTVIGFVGTLLGVVFGVMLAINAGTIVSGIEQFFGIKFLDAEVYYISDLPSDLRIADVIKISVVAFGMSVLATLYPAWRAAKTPPAEALRYE